MRKDSTWLAGVDGCKSGWFVVLWEPTNQVVRWRVVEQTTDLFDLPEQPAALVIDMVIGLPEQAQRGGRACDRAARKLLGWPRSSSIFSPPCRAALACMTYPEALAVNRALSPEHIGISKEAFHLFPKIRALDACWPQPGVYEGHPELSFYALNGNAPMPASKHKPEGRAQRHMLLLDAGFDAIDEALAHRTKGVKPDDVLDAFAVCWSARRVAQGTAVSLPAPSPVDALGRPMAVCF
ncbi:MAG: DUF429 domain-containing protein [Rhodothermales bacterium]